jgi:hypothetical protein
MNLAFNRKDRHAQGKGANKFVYKLLYTFIILMAVIESVQGTCKVYVATDSGNAKGTTFPYPP